MRTRSKVLFLDVDGVLNTYRGTADLEPRLVARVKAVLRKTGACLVMSSSWRQCQDYAARVWGAFGVAGPDQFVTPIHGALHRRGSEIAAFLRDHPEVRRYAILDDNAWMLSSQARVFVQTDPNSGITTRDAARLVEILGEERADPAVNADELLRMGGKRR